MLAFGAKTYFLLGHSVHV